MASLSKWSGKVKSSFFRGMGELQYELSTFSQTRSQKGEEQRYLLYHCGDQ